jgi:hypothetical protein
MQLSGCNISLHNVSLGGRQRRWTADRYLPHTRALCGLTPDGTATVDIRHPNSSLVPTLPQAKYDKPRIYCCNRRAESSSDLKCSICHIRGVVFKRRIHTCNVTTYRNTVPWQCGRDSWPSNVCKVGYAVTLRACRVRCRYLAVAPKGWYGYGLSRSGRAKWHVTTVRSCRILYIHDASGSRNKLGTPRCNARRILLRHEARDESSDRNAVSCQSLATLRRYGTR